MSSRGLHLGRERIALGHYDKRTGRHRFGDSGCRIRGQEVTFFGMPDGMEIDAGPALERDEFVTWQIKHEFAGRSLPMEGLLQSVCVTLVACESQHEAMIATLRGDL